MRARTAAAACLVVAASLARAQLLAPEDPDWREAEAPPPPALRVDGLLPIEMPGSQLRFGVDPQSITVGKDGVVRYVVVATSSTGAVNGMYEGIKCASAEGKVYARHSSGSGWAPTREAEWRSLNDGSNLTRHSLEIARRGVCMGRSANTSAVQIAHDLQDSGNHRFRPETR